MSQSLKALLILSIVFSVFIPVLIKPSNQTYHNESILVDNDNESDIIVPIKVDIMDSNDDNMDDSTSNDDDFDDTHVMIPQESDKINTINNQDSDSELTGAMDSIDGSNHSLMDIHNISEFLQPIHEQILMLTETMKKYETKIKKMEKQFNNNYNKK
mmetsp:Transcript_99363/g.121582  ORF Transcript_99363/g.121582 Transcript_99363/m.121582 type:complete len:157 (-) Transcript_99363:112-582(-)